MLVTNDLIIVKSINNNVLLVRDNGVEKILFEKGIGFGKKFGDVILAGAEVSKIFVISDDRNKKNFNEIVSTVDNKLIGIFEEALSEIQDELGEELNESIHIGLIEHLAFSVKRLKNDQEILNPFLNEVETLYSKEFELALKLARKIEEEIDIKIPDGEVAFIAIHIHSARNNGKLANTIKYAYLSNTIIEYVEDQLGIEIDRQSLDYTRFLIHIRFAIERVINNNKIQNDLKDIIKEKYSLSYKISKDIAKIISETLECEVCENEVAYITMHIERFRISLVYN
ncbi:MAG: PRD domain-containing protein [Clostridium celatum]|nr:PRD domain-containing protein [Clostridium celatum]